MMEELWKPIPGYESIYEVSNYGNIRSVDGKTTYSSFHGTRVWKSRIIKQKHKGRKCHSGHKDARVTLWKDGKWKTHLVARLVAMAWVDGYEDGLTVNHIDGDPTNNKSTNLEWVCLAENIRKGFENGLYTTCEPCELIDDDGNSYFFRSRQECCSFLGRGNSYITNRVLRNQLNLPVSSKHGTNYRIVLSKH